MKLIYGAKYQLGNFIEDQFLVLASLLAVCTALNSSWALSSGQRSSTFSEIQLKKSPAVMAAGLKSKTLSKYFKTVYYSCTTPLITDGAPFTTGFAPMAGSTQLSIFNGKSVLELASVSPSQAATSTFF